MSSVDFLALPNFSDMFVNTAFILTFLYHTLSYAIPPLILKTYCSFLRNYNILKMCNLVFCVTGCVSDSFVEETEEEEDSISVKN